MKIKEVRAQKKCIIEGDFNTTLHQGKKMRLYSKGPVQGTFGRSDLGAGFV